jgi:copper chaperone
METKQFKTNIKCSGCVAKVTPGLNETAGENNWNVDLESPEKILTISGDSVDKEKISKALEKAGYHAEELA